MENRKHDPNSFTVTEYAEKEGISDRTARERLAKYIKNGILVKTFKKVGTRYLNSYIMSYDKK